MNRRKALKFCAATTIAAAMPVPLMAKLYEPSLAQLGKRRGIGFGSAVSGDALDSARYASLILTECSLMAAENALKWKYLEPQDGVRNFGEARFLANFADRNGLVQRGHCFIWNHEDRMPPWLIDLAADLAKANCSKMTSRMWRHGAFLAQEFPDVKSWDALNEAIDPNSGELRETELSRLLGDRLVDLSFHILSEKCPGQQLVYNDSMNWESSPIHRDGVLRLLECALARGVPIDALGIQSHLGKTLGRPSDEPAWRRFLEQVQGMGLDVIITELDCSDRHIVERDPVFRDKETAAYLKGYLDLTLSFTNVRDIVVWSLSDGESYMNRQSYPEYRWRADELPLRGHPYDQRLRAKPMRKAIASSLIHAPEREWGSLSG